MACFLLGINGLSRAQEAKTRQKPRLVVNVVVGQMRYDYMLRFADNFSDKGFLRMIRDGVSCDRAMYNFLNTSTASGLTTIATGANPSTHGVIGSHWFNHTTSEKIDLTLDKSCYTVGSDELDIQISPANLIASTLGDQLKSISPKSKVISIAFSPLSATLIGGQTTDAAYWVNPRQGNWVTSTYYMPELPAWAQSFNKERYVDTYSSKEWVSMKLQDQYHNTNRVMMNFEPTLQTTRKQYNYSNLCSSPWANYLIKDFAVQAIIYEDLGKDDHTDLLNIVFDPMRLIGEKYGTQSAEIEDAYYRLDEDLGALIDMLEERVGRDRLLVVVSSDHGAADPVVEGGRMPSGRFNAQQYTMLMNGFLGANLGNGEQWVLDFSNNQIYLNRPLIAKKGLNLADVQNKIADFAIQFRGVATAITSGSMTNSYFSGGVISKAQNSYFPGRSGDVILNLLPGWTVDNEKLSDSGSAYNYDTHVPLLWYGGIIGTQNIARDVDMTDLAPTIAHIIEIAPPNAASGKPIIEIYAK